MVYDFFNMNNFIFKSIFVLEKKETDFTLSLSLLQNQLNVYYLFLLRLNLAIILVYLY